MPNALDALRERGFVKQTVFETELYDLLGRQSVTFYVGFDPTADSLHIGHYVPLMAMAHMQRMGHRPIVLIGGGTALIGDPTDRNDMRSMMSLQTVRDNVAAFERQLRRFLCFEGPNAAVIVDNSQWLAGLNYIEFIRDIGVHFSVNKMLTADCFRTRLEKGLSFLEFNYMLMQGYDFLELYRRFGCVLQMGGNDQWSNILAGADLIRRVASVDAFAVTFPLLETSDGRKMGKTQRGALWLSAEKTSVYDFYQYFRNVEDSKVRECLMLLTFLQTAEIIRLTSHSGEALNEAKSTLAFEVTRLVHGQEAALEAARQAQGAFGGDTANMPTQQIAAGSDTTIVDILHICAAASTKSEARRLIVGGGVRIDDSVVQSVNDTVSTYTDQMQFVLHKGKKFHLLVKLQPSNQAK